MTHPRDKYLFTVGTNDEGKTRVTINGTPYTLREIAQKPNFHGHALEIMTREDNTGSAMRGELIKQLPPPLEKNLDGLNQYIQTHYPDEFELSISSVIHRTTGDYNS